MPDVNAPYAERDPVGIKAFGIEGLIEALAAIGQPSYRAKQIARWLYQRRASSFG